MRKTVVPFLLSVFLLVILLIGSASADVGIINIPDNVKKIGEEAFSGINPGEKFTVVLPSGVEEIADNVFPDPDCVEIIAEEGTYAYRWAVRNGYIAIAETSLEDFQIENGIIVRYTGNGGRIIIPSTDRDGNMITGIGDYAFCNRGDITGNLYLPDTVVTIGDEAFSSCTGITGNLYLPDSLVTIGNNAFRGCSGISKVRLPRNLESAGSGAFCDCPNIEKSVEIPASVKKWSHVFDDSVAELWTHFILEYTVGPDEVRIDRFWGCGDASVVFPDMIEGKPVTVIGEHACNWAKGLYGELVLPKHLRTIEKEAFAACSNIRGGDLIIPDEVTSIGEDAFWGLPMEGAIIMGDNVISIGKSAFCGSAFKGPIRFSQSLQEIGNAAFYWCQELNCTLNFPESLEKIGEEAFTNCSHLQGDLRLPSKLTTVGRQAFRGCHFGGKLVLPDHLAFIDDQAFEECSFSGNLELPQTLKHIGQWAFAINNFTGMLELPDGLEHIGNHAFSATSLSGTVVIPLSVSYVGSYAFDTWFGMTVIDQQERHPGYEFRDITKFWSLNKKTYEIEGYNNCPVENIELPVEYNGAVVTYIGEMAFYACDQLNGRLVIPDGYYKIEDAAFQLCTGLTGVPVFPDSLKIICPGAFYGCTGLEGILTLNDDVEVFSSSFEGTKLTVIQNGSVIYQGAEE